MVPLPEADDILSSWSTMIYSFQPTGLQVQCIRPLSAGLAKHTPWAGHFWMSFHCLLWPRGKLNTLTFPNSENTGRSPQASPYTSHQGQIRPALTITCVFLWNLDTDPYLPLLSLKPQEMPLMLSQELTQHTLLWAMVAPDPCVISSSATFSPKDSRAGRDVSLLPQNPHFHTLKVVLLKNPPTVWGRGRRNASILATVFKEILTLSLSEFLLFSCMS